ncbi:hypothetical protein [Dyadobacter luticola]|uniref:Uncharacterized protein n=1 Tax=Dyadobacter luticola TaxID=1979387 RepID=A0A5R9KQ26_9BACT|nr:hypothetical protein [Dyadobacter luticola]TLU98218.1 hypothetical protein FEN17_25945 [Dyadobacter luticola]
MKNQQTIVENQIAALTAQQKQALIQQETLIREFFQQDSATEMISSLNAMTETVLFSSDVQNVTTEIRTNIVNNLRLVTFLSRLDVNYRNMKR